MTAPRIQKLRKGASWCGPAALAYLCGLTYEQAEAAIRRARKSCGDDRKIIRGVHDWAMIPELRKHYIMKPKWPTNRPTLSRWLEWERVTARCYLVSVTGHYVAVTPAGQFDNQHGLTDVGEHHARCRVRRVYELTPRKGKAHLVGLTLTRPEASA